MSDDRIQWHQGFQGGLEFRLRKYKTILEYHHEHPLSKKPIVVDTLVIEKKEGIVINEDIASIFLGHNIVEYKNPRDALSIDEYYNLLAYMCRYKATAGTTNAIKADHVTGTLIKDGKPAKAFKEIGMRANSGLYEKLWRDPEMCTAFKELFKDEIREAERNGQAKLGALIAKLIESGRTEEILRASTDEAHRERLYAEYRMA